ncbi:hypothetical protein CRM22_006951 [Opisthorchis felineus]|uniref:Uncharacterized protein n=1 Tax=Opisthorchis felineus TaxID=147828 RepID=A0A4S2LKD9_OPIFE|nr:hypothetical protein CRM22_006951 [Opisthorchis felineus]
MMVEEEDIQTSRYCPVLPEECVGDTRAKWLCPPGYHPPEFFKCGLSVPQVDALGKPDERFRWNQSLNRVKHPLDRYRPWAYDRSGLRLLDWESSDVDCRPPKLGNFDYLPVCLADPSPLTQHFNSLDNLNALHPRYLLEHYIYRDPDEYHTAKEQGKYACYLDCDAREFRELKPMNQREIMRLRFATNNYHTFDDWKEDPNDELLAQFDTTKTQKEAAQ